MFTHIIYCNMTREIAVFNGDDLVEITSYDEERANELAGHARFRGCTEKVYHEGKNQDFIYAVAI